MTAAAPRESAPNENLPARLMEALSRMKPETREAMIKDIQKLQASKPEAARALLRADANVLANAYIMHKEGGSSEAWEKLLELAQNKERPKERSWLGRQWVRLRFMAMQGLKSGAIMGAFTAAFKGGAHLLGFTVPAGTDYSPEVKASNEALLGARRAIIEAGGTVPGWETMTEEQRNHILSAAPLVHASPAASILSQAGMAALAGTGLGATFAGISSQGQVDQAVREDRMAQILHDQMHSDDIQRPNVPQRAGAAAMRET